MKRSNRYITLVIPFQTYEVYAGNNGMATQLIFNDPRVKIGFHITKESTLYESIKRMLDTPLRSYQLYISNARGWKPPVVDLDDLLATRYLLETNPRNVFTHASLLYNMAGVTKGPLDPKFDTNLSLVRRNLGFELDITAAHTGGNETSSKGTVVHVGSRTSTREGVNTIIETINHVLREDTQYTKNIAKALEIPVYEFKRSRLLLLENSAGEGSKIGSTLEEISSIIEGVDPEYQDQIGVCIDTAHAFGAGIADFGTPDGVANFYNEFDNIIGLDKLKLFHLNDSRVPFNGKGDRHENLGLGCQFGADGSLRGKSRDGSQGLKSFIDYTVYYDIPFIGEPPAKTKDGTPGPGGVYDYQVIDGVYPLTL